MEERYRCQRCGKEFVKKENTKFCRFCGYPVGPTVVPYESLQAARPVPAPGDERTVLVNRQDGGVAGADGDATVILQGADLRGNGGPAPQMGGQAYPPPQGPVYTPPTPSAGSGGKRKPPKPPKTPKPPKPPKQTKDKKGGALVAVIVALVIVLIALVIGAVVMLGKMGILDFPDMKDKLPLQGREETEQEESDREEDGEPLEETADEDEAAGLIEQGDAIFEENKEKVLEDQLRSEAQLSLQEAISLYQEAGTNDAYREEAASRIRDALSYYEKGVQAQIDMLMGQEVSADLYGEIVRELDDALAYGQSLVEDGYDVEMRGTSDLRNNIEDKYKGLYIEKYNGFIDEYNWNVRSNEEFARGAYEAFPSDDPDDPIRLRYAYAKAWLVHQEIVEGMADGSLDADGAVNKIMDAMEETDYCEFLLEEAENYALNSSRPNMNYFKALKKGNIIPDSSSKEYTATEIAALGLSPAQLRYARMEIYARHGMKTWDTSINGVLGGAQIDMYKFMSYNDFGVYSTDNMNGLTATERHNIRVIAQLQKDSMSSGYFMIK